MTRTRATLARDRRLAASTRSPASADIEAVHDRHAVRRALGHDHAGHARRACGPRSCRGTASDIASCRREIPQRANIWALASLGVEQRDLRERRRQPEGGDRAAAHGRAGPAHRPHARGRPSTFFGRGIVAHIGFDEPFCPRTERRAVRRRVRRRSRRRIGGGTLVVIEGPAFSTRAESSCIARWGADIIGMTALPEAKLAREAGICYATLACVTDYDTWHEGHDSVSVELIVANLRSNVAHGAAHRRRRRAAPCRRATAAARPRSRARSSRRATFWPEATERDLAPILARARVAERVEAKR